MQKKNSGLKHIFETNILENTLIAEDVFSMRLEYPESERNKSSAGQFVNLYLNREDLLLPRPISICRLQEGEITLVYGVVGQGTKEMSAYKSGDIIRVSSPLGNGYDLSGKNLKEALLIGGGLGVPPLLELSNRLMAMNISTHIVLGFKDEPFLIEEFGKSSKRVHVATDSGSHGFRGTILDFIKSSELPKKGMHYDVCFACGPIPMLKELGRYFSGSQMGFQVSLEERMGCGFGSCLGCVCKIETKEGIEQMRVCKDGPVFNGRQVVWDA